jgi:hypothetical protein
VVVVVTVVVTAVVVVVVAVVRRTSESVMVSVDGKMGNISLDRGTQGWNMNCMVKLEMVNIR